MASGYPEEREASSGEIKFGKRLTELGFGNLINVTNGLMDAGLSGRRVCGGHKIG